MIKAKARTSFSQLALISIALLVLAVISWWPEHYRSSAAAIVTTPKGTVALSDIAVYWSHGGDDATKRRQDNFAIGDPIQIGFHYSEQTNGALTSGAVVKFVVVNRHDAKTMLTTSLFRLDPRKNDLFININNGNLKPGTYQLQIRDKRNQLIYTINYTIQ